MVDRESTSSCPLKADAPERPVASQVHLREHVEKNRQNREKKLVDHQRWTSGFLAQSSTFTNVLFWKMPKLHALSVRSAKWQTEVGHTQSGQGHRPKPTLPLATLGAHQHAPAGAQVEQEACGLDVCNSFAKSTAACAVDFGGEVFTLNPKNINLHSSNHLKVHPPCPVPCPG